MTREQAVATYLHKNGVHATVTNVMDATVDGTVRVPGGHVSVGATYLMYVKPMADGKLKFFDVDSMLTLLELCETRGKR